MEYVLETFFVKLRHLEAGGALAGQVTVGSFHHRSIERDWLENISFQKQSDSQEFPKIGLTSQHDFLTSFKQEEVAKPFQKEVVVTVWRTDHCNQFHKQF